MTELQHRDKREPHIKRYFSFRCFSTERCFLSAAYKVNVKSSTAEGDFMTFTATVVEVLKNTDKGETRQIFSFYKMYMLDYVTSDITLDHIMLHSISLKRL